VLEECLLTTLSLNLNERNEEGDRAFDAIQAMDAWFRLFRMQIQEPPLLIFQELKNRKIENMDKMRR